MSEITLLALTATYGALSLEYRLTVANTEGALRTRAFGKLEDVLNEADRLATLRQAERLTIERPEQPATIVDAVRDVAGHWQTWEART